MTRISSRITSLWRQIDVIRDEIRIRDHTSETQKTTILILCNFVFSPLRLHSLFSRLNTPKLWPYMVIWREFEFI